MRDDNEKILIREMDMFGELLKAAVGLVVETPVALATDVITLGGALTDQEKPYTAEALSKVLENVQKSTE